MSTQSAIRRKVLYGGKGSIINGPVFHDKPLIDGEFTGNGTSEFASSYTCAPGELVYLTSTFKWAKADSNAAAALNSNQLGICMEDGVDGQFITVALAWSFIYLTAFPTFTGVPVFMSATAGAITETEPSENYAASRVIGYGIHADMLFFNPAPVSYAGKAVQIVLPTVAGQVIGPIDATRVSGYTTAAAYDIVILDANNKWQKADADGAGLFDGILGMVVVGGATDVAITVALKGAFIKTAGTYTLGAEQYLSKTAGGLSALPTTGTAAQIVVGKAWSTTVLQLVFEGYHVTSGA